MVMLRDNCVQVGLGVGITGFAALFYWERHLVQVVSGLIKCSIWLLRVLGFLCGCMFLQAGALKPSVGPLRLKVDHRGGQITGISTLG